MATRRRRRPPTLRIAAFATALLTLGGCASSAAVRAARAGDVSELRRSIAAEKAAGKLDRRRARAIAQAVAEREIAQADASRAKERIDEAGPCARQLADALRRRAGGADATAAAATLALLDARKFDGDRDALVHAHARAPDPAWRAVAARSAEGGRFAGERRAFYLDPDEQVRLGALRAALAAPEPGDAPALVSVLARDPNPLAQSLAARTLGQFASEQVVLDLADAYRVADETLRQSIVDAWGMRAARAGGERELVRVVETEHGLSAIEAAAVLVRSGISEAGARVGARALVRAIAGGPPAHRLLAVVNAPLGDVDARQALRTASLESDPALRVAALARLGQDRTERASALRALRAAADKGNLPALVAVAELGDPAASAGLMRHLGSASPATRLVAGRALIALHDEASAAQLLADDNADVRWSAACTVAASEER